LLGLESWSAAAAAPEACAGPGAGAGREKGSVEEGKEACAAPSVTQGRGGDMGGSTGRERKRDRQTGKRKARDDDASECDVSNGHAKRCGGSREMGFKDTGEQSQTADVDGSTSADVAGGGGAASGRTQGAVRGSASKRFRHRHDCAPAGSGLEAGHGMDEVLHECFFNREVDLNTRAGRAPNPKFLLTFRESQGLENDADVYLAELIKRGFEVRKLPIPKCSQKLAKELREDIAKQLSWCEVLIGFESIGNEDDWLWKRLKQERFKRPSLLVALVPNLEWCKLSDLWTKHTVKELLKSQTSDDPCGVDVLIAKTECTFERLQQLWLGQRFAREKGNLLLIPHMRKIVKEPSQQPFPPRRDVIVFAGYSDAKNTLECVKAAVTLVKKKENKGKLGKVIIKCSHRCSPPSAAGDETTCQGSAAKECICQRTFDKHSSEGVVELVEERITEVQKANLYRRCRLAICASKREGFGHTILEAAAYGCQVVTTDGMPMKSILRRQVGLAKPEKRMSWNLGISYDVRAAAIVKAAEALLEEDHDVASCQRQQTDRAADFSSHFGHFINSIVPLGAQPRQPPRCSNLAHHCASLQIRQMTCEECQSGRLHTALKHVNRNQPDQLVWVCSNRASNPECDREILDGGDLEVMV
jgi:glycosyltransferase involved in cell wall biosynthesis